MRTHTLTLITVAALLAAPGAARAIVIDPSARMDGDLAASGDGLNADFFLVSPQDGFLDAGSPAVIESNILAHLTGAPTATFTATEIDYPNGVSNPWDGTADDGVEILGDSDPLSQFLGVDFASVSPAQDPNVFNVGFVFRGFIKITSGLDLDPGTAGVIEVDFANQSDDGVVFTIGGSVFDGTGAEMFRAGNRGFGAIDFATAEFPGEGFYEMELVFWQGFGGIGIEFMSSILGGTAKTFDAATDPAGDFASIVGILPQAVLFTSVPTADGGDGGGGVIPAPATLALLGLGALGLARRRRIA